VDSVFSGLPASNFQLYPKGCQRRSSVRLEYVISLVFLRMQLLMLRTRL